MLSRGRDPVQAKALATLLGHLNHAAPSESPLCRERSFRALAICCGDCPDFSSCRFGSSVSSFASDSPSTPFLKQLGRRDRIETFACFAAALREGGLDTGRTETDGTRTLSGTTRATLDGVALAYRLQKFESPIHDTCGQLERVLAFWLSI
jgi:hypothetical protein